MYDPHTHPILVLQNLINSLDFHYFFDNFYNLSDKIQNLDYLFIMNSPLEDKNEFKKKYKNLISFVNFLDIPIIFKSKNYHRFFINNYLKKKINLKTNFLNERYFSSIDKIYIKLIKKDYKKYYKILESYFDGILKVVDAFTTLEFLEFYTLINKKIKNKKLEIYYLLDPSIIFKVNLKKLKLILSSRYFLGFKFFVDGTLANKDAMFYDSSLNFNSKLYLNMNFYRKFLRKLYYILRYIKIDKISFAFHCVGDKAVDFTLSNLINDYIVKISKMVKIKFRIEHALFINDNTFKLLLNNLDRYKDIDFYFVFNPNFFFIDIDFLRNIKNKELASSYFIFRLKEVFDIFRNYNNFYIAFASDCPVSPCKYELYIFLLKNYLIYKKNFNM
jgi:hypothetical protein